jgi:hypothetical protein
MNVTPDLQQNIFVTVYLLFSHNYIALAYLIGLLIGIILSLYRPSRYATFILLSFAILLFSFEYDKHIIDALREQTLKSLITVTPHFRVQRIVNLALTEILPILLYISGWSLLFVSVIWGGLHVNNKSKIKEQRSKKPSKST